jgi:transposase-like protein
MARPTKLSPELQQRIVQALSAGAYVETAAAMAGVSKQTLYSWLKRGADQAQGPFREFLDAVEKAQAEAEVRDIALIAKAAQTQWQAAAWRLERKFPEKWGRKTRVEHTGEDGGPVQVSIAINRTVKE